MIRNDFIKHFPTLPNLFCGLIFPGYFEIIQVKISFDLYQSHPFILWKFDWKLPPDNLEFCVYTSKHHSLHKRVQEKKLCEDR